MEDLRKNYIVSLIRSYFVLKETPIDENNKYLNYFLDDGNCLILYVLYDKNGNLSFTNNIIYSSNILKVLIFFKIKQDIITPENFENNIFVFSMMKSPKTMFYHSLQTIFAPILITENENNLEPELQHLLKQLEYGISKSIDNSNEIYREHNSEFHVILSLDDEIAFWSSNGNYSKKVHEREESLAFYNCITIIKKEIVQMNNIPILDSLDIIETIHNLLDDLWRLDDFFYPHDRMKNIMEIIGITISRFIQNNLKNVELWELSYSKFEENLNPCIEVMEFWVSGCDRLIKLIWINYAPHRWDSNKIDPKTILPYSRGFLNRLREIFSLRRVYHQLSNLLTKSEQEDCNGDIFESLKKTIAWAYNPYADTAWKEAISQFEKKIIPLEERVLEKLRVYLKQVSSNTLQFVQVVRRYRSLLERPSIRTALQSNREALLAAMRDLVAKWNLILKDSNNAQAITAITILDVPQIAAQIHWARNLRCKADDMKETASQLLQDLKEHQELESALTDLSENLLNYENEQFDSWCDDMSNALRDESLSLRTDSPVVEFEKGRLMRVTYNPKLVAFVKETRYLASLGHRIPVKLQRTAQTASTFAIHAKSLEQIANFHNTIGERMIPSQRPMMLQAALELEKLVQQTDSVVSWRDTKSVEDYISRLQKAIERLANENSFLSSYHLRIRQQLINLMSTDLLRDEQKWKTGLKNIRSLINEVKEKGFVNLNSWIHHWDMQLYKALDTQYQLVIKKGFDQELPKISVELVYRRQQLQYSPPIEELRMKYYGLLKRFLSIPTRFRGVDDGLSSNTLFQTIIHRNAHQFESLYNQAENLFKRLEELRKQWIPRVALGTLDFESIAAEQLKIAEDWDREFRQNKSWGQKIASLPSIKERIGCFEVSTLPIREEIELHNRRYGDVLVTSLHTSISRDIASLVLFCNEADESLSGFGNKQPSTSEELGAAENTYKLLLEKSPQMGILQEEAHRKNRILAIWTKENVFQLAEVASKWETTSQRLMAYETVLASQVSMITSNLKVQIENIFSEGKQFKNRWSNREIDVNASIGDFNNDAIWREKRIEWQALKETYQTLFENCSHFNIQNLLNEDKQWNELINEMKSQEYEWSMREEFNQDLESLANEIWIIFRTRSYRFDELLTRWQRRIDEAKSPENEDASKKLLLFIERYKAYIPHLKLLRGDAYSDRHWSELFSTLNMPAKSIDTLTLSDFLSIPIENINENLKIIQNLNSRANNEISVRQALAELDSWENDSRFTLIEHHCINKTSISLIKDYADVQSKVGELQGLVQSVKHAGGYEDRTQIWSSKLAELENHLENLSSIQRKWVYLEPIFGISGSQAPERPRFERIDRDFRHIMSLISQDRRVISLCRIPNLKSSLDFLLDQLARCQRSLSEYLEEKRCTFPRFYFLGDEDLLELLGQTSRHEVIQRHVKKLFAGIYTLELTDENKAIAMLSQQEEKVPFNEPVNLTSRPEEWLSVLENQMRSTLQSLVNRCLIDMDKGSSDPLHYPSQVLSLAESIVFVEKCEQAIVRGTLTNLLSSLKVQLEGYVKTKSEWFSSSQKNDANEKVLFFKLQTLMIDTTHRMRILEELISHNVMKISDWLWQRQLRLYRNKSPNGNISAKMVDAEFIYGYEYQGNAPRLVHTPLTDRCYLTLSQAMHMGLGGHPYGPAGTGKTESVKALAGHLGRHVLVFNCDEGIDVHAMTRILIGLARAGTWGCFDEFNRLEEATLSAIAGIIHTIQKAIKDQSSFISIDKLQIPIDLKCAIFVTLNPAGQGYGARNRLPDNLKQLFRPVAMTKPDAELISEVVLYCEGFRHARVLSYKLVELFRLADQLLSKQQHYDWGLRALKTVLSGCGNALRILQKGSYETKVEVETLIVANACRLDTLSKLTDEDAHRFENLLKDIFTEYFSLTSDEKENIENKINTNELAKDLETALEQACVDLNVQKDERQFKKCKQLFEQLHQRMGVVLVGPPGTGKTTIYKLLSKALIKLGKTVRLHIISPKAVTRTQLLGHIDLDTRQWNDGILTLAANKVYNLPTENLGWIICDGDVDPDWAEALNSVLDDNRLLTLPSGWRVQFADNVNFIFETHSLANASPATISRLGIVYMSENNINVDCLIKSWLIKYPEHSELQDIELFNKALSWLRENGQPALSNGASLTSTVYSLFSHITNIKTHPQFTYALILALGANLTPSSRQLFTKQVLEWSGEALLGIDDGPRLNHIYYDTYRDSLGIYETKSDMENDSLVMTADVRRHIDALLPWLHAFEPILLLGPSGSGKSALLEYCFAQLPTGTEWTTVHCSALTKPQHILDSLAHSCSYVSSHSGKVLKPKHAEKLIVFLKNIDLTRPDRFGTRRLLAFLHQVISHNGFHDPHILEWINVENINWVTTIISSSTNQSSQKNINIDPRFASSVYIYSIDSPSPSDIRSICERHLNRALSKEIQSSSLAGVMVQIYQQVREVFRGSHWPHYCFSLRELIKWCWSLPRYSPFKEKDVLFVAMSHEAIRIFRDRLTTSNDIEEFDKILNQVVSTNNVEEIYFATSEQDSQSGKEILQLERLTREEWRTQVHKAANRFSQDGDESKGPLLLEERLKLTAQTDRAITCPRGHLLLAGRAGVGRRLALRLVAARHDARIITPRTPADLKTILQVGAIDGEQVIVLLQEFHLDNSSLLDMVNSLVASGEIPGLYTPDELESIVSTLKDKASQEGFEGISLTSYFAQRIRQKIHVVLTVESSTINDIWEKNPGLIKECSIVWLESWSSKTMLSVPSLLFQEKEILKLDKTDLDFAANIMTTIHLKVKPILATPRRYMSLITTYERLLMKRRVESTRQVSRLKAGLSRLTEARQMVADLEAEASKQREQLSEQQAQANAALQLISDTMRDTNVQKSEMQTLKEQQETQSKQLAARKEAIDKELAEVEPLIEEAKRAVADIKTEALSEVRSMRAPPEAVRDILEGVLRLMGIQDTSWNSMKTFLAKRGIKEDIRSFDARAIIPANRTTVERLLENRGASFKPEIAKRASAAAAPLASWVLANVRYSKVIDSIRPLEQEQSTLLKHLKAVEDQVSSLSSGLTDVNQIVAELKVKLNDSVKAATTLEIRLEEAERILHSAEGLVVKLDDEYTRWQKQLIDSDYYEQNLSKWCLLAAAYVNYMSSESEENIQLIMKQWNEMLISGDFNTGVSDHKSEKELNESQFNFDVIQFLLNINFPNDEVINVGNETSEQHAAFILNSELTPLLLDPNGEASQWLENQLKLSEESVSNNKNNVRKQIEVISQTNNRFTPSLELAIRFGKTLIVDDIDRTIPAIMYPILRRDYIFLGSGRKVIQMGDKMVDVHESFELFLCTRNQAIANRLVREGLVNCVNMSISSAGLEAKLLSIALSLEKPELQKRRDELNRQQADLSRQLKQLQDTVLQELSSAQGDILENKELLDSLNAAKASSAAVTTALSDSKQIREEIEKECDVYRPLASFSAKLGLECFDTLADSQLCPMYRFGLNEWLKLFKETLEADSPENKTNESVSERIEAHRRRFITYVYRYFSRALFKSDQLAFAIYLSHLTEPHNIPGNEWKTFIDQSGGSENDSNAFPSWIPKERHFQVSVLKNGLPTLYEHLRITDQNAWTSFLNEFDNREIDSLFPIHLSKTGSLTPWQRILIIQALRPDRLHESLYSFAINTLGIVSLSRATNLREIISETSKESPILIVLSPLGGADPTKELTELFEDVKPKDTYHEISLGDGQLEIAIDLLKTCIENGHWLCLKNLHLVINWLPILMSHLSKETLESAHENFRLWLTSEPHENFPEGLIRISLKIAYEAPAGIKNNLLRTYSRWASNKSSKGGGLLKARARFCLAWLHAIVQERRTFIPQGWRAWYEFTDYDLEAAANHALEPRLHLTNGGSIEWPIVQGICLDALYGGRISDQGDRRILEVYFREWLNSNALERNGFLAGIQLPDSENPKDIKKLIQTSINDKESYLYFGLPANVERSWKQVSASNVVRSLRVILNNISTQEITPFQNEYNWQNQLHPLLNLWKKLNQGTGLLQNIPESQEKDPLGEFLQLERQMARGLIQRVHKTLATLAKLSKVQNNPQEGVPPLAVDLIKQKTPLSWLDIWPQGPIEPIPFVRVLVKKALAIEQWLIRWKNNQFFSGYLSLTDLLRPRAFLNAFKQYSARLNQVPINELSLATTWGNKNENNSSMITLTGLLIEGAYFDRELILQPITSPEHPTFTSAPNCSLEWHLDKKQDFSQTIHLPVYLSSNREIEIFTAYASIALKNDRENKDNVDKWIKASIALYLE